MASETCAGCRFFSKFAGDEGDCRAHPPTAALPIGSDYGYWPAVKIAWWCGEHQPKEPPAHE